MMKKLLRSGALLGAIFLASAVVAGTPVASARHNDVVGHVYVNNNTATNTVSAFDRHADGSLTPLPGSPFATGGMGGVNAPSQGAIQQTSDGRFLLAVNTGSNEISVMRIRGDGGLQQVERGTVPSNGITPVSIAVHDDLVYVANTGAGGSNYTGFKLDRNGRLRAIRNSTFALPDAALPGNILISPQGDRLIGIRVGLANSDSRIDGFTLNNDGRITPAPGSPFMSEGGGPFGSAFRAVDAHHQVGEQRRRGHDDDRLDGAQLFVTNAHDGPGAGSVSTYTVDEDGVLDSVPGSPVANGQSGTCWLVLSPDGRYAFALNTGSASVSRYSIAPNGSLTLIGNTPISNAMGLRPFDIGIDPNGRFVYVTGASRVVGFSVSGGSTLTELPSSPFALPMGTTFALGIVVN